LCKLKKLISGKYNVEQWLPEAEMGRSKEGGEMVVKGCIIIVRLEE
jgi:hypothetical protein